MILYFLLSAPSGPDSSISPAHLHVTASSDMPALLAATVTQIWAFGATIIAVWSLGVQWVCSLHAFRSVHPLTFAVALPRSKHDRITSFHHACISPIHSFAAHACDICICSTSG